MKINHNLFKQLIDTAKVFVAKGDNRPALRYIKVDVGNGKISATALDGYRGTKATAKIEQSEQATFFILPFNLSKDKSGGKQIEITLTDNVATITVETEYGNMQYQFNQDDIKFVDYDKIIPSKDGKTTVAFDTNLLRNTLEAFKTSRVCPMQCYIGTPTQPVLITTDIDGVNAETLILPVRSV